MDTLKWIELAVSKDETRFNLTKVYRDTNALVATDGHRLHISNGLADAKPQFLDGSDAKFPDYKQVLPKAEPTHVYELNFDKEFIGRLKKVVTLLRYDDRTCGCSFEANGDSLIIQSRGGGDLKLELKIPAERKSEKPIIQVGFNLSYFLDALSLIDTIGSVELSFNDQLGPILVKHASGPLAVIMPMRLTK